MVRPVCYVYNGGVCCASYCPGRYFHLIEKRSRLKSINYERWDIMDLWVELYQHCKFKVFCRKVYIIPAFRDDAFQKRSKRFPFLLPVSSQLHLCRTHLGSLATVKEVSHIGNAHLIILRYELRAFLKDIKDNGMIKYSRDLHPHEQPVIKC